ncbi:pyridine nucleotide-disulfide oxidoreductase, putative [Trichomonas vaginalis G3]|uniref:Dihydrothymine dehydrogenase n=1 Tax=Trichomonas vaginalis (strain ATCC PRA-98 / G3) TaxID=412133 RepID=A2F282_TRIV3|nr:dihydropyrimidine dehydrogenase (NADP+) protein [Trichomonas vaginalis G3]EAY00961.1 pyridine nucleotide-disulfide oxidoreductase, putative [Trichomonas vaginalis G3]KAI5516755.1 dihydropyrimidine dehydrogenase (NADP+) protein [Trichomonas vaginalis G3]|eukprot:XP_001313878.1 pyridine nucleotide-disulphide oxidoreductase [Trichomonas vaginalis G3]
MFVPIPSKIDAKKGYRYLNPPHFRSELDKCLQCSEKPCNQECPCKVDPSEFINAAMGGEPSDMDYAALCIYSKQPLGSVCGVVCPVTHCMSRCSRSKLDASINIPALQAEIIRRACKEGRFRELIKKNDPTGKKIAIVGGGPSGLSAATCLASRGHKVTIFEKNSEVGGDIQLIPKYRFPGDVIQMDLELLKIVGDTEIKLNTTFEKSMENDYDAVIYAIRSQNITRMNCPGKELAITPNEFFHLPTDTFKDKVVVINGCGGVAVDVANVASKYGAKYVTIFYRRTVD